VPHRLAEAARLGFRAAIVPLGRGEHEEPVRRVQGLKVVGVPDVDSALRLLGLSASDAPAMFRPAPAEPGRPALGLA
jgi:DNA repair protein RadA/Sms